MREPLDVGVKKLQWYKYYYLNKFAAAGGEAEGVRADERPEYPSSEGWNEGF